MIWRPTRFTDLIDFRKLSKGRFDRAFDEALPDVGYWCDVSGSIKRSEVRDDVFDQLGIAFNKGLLELARQPSARLVDNGAPRLQLRWLPYFDIVEAGTVAHSLRIEGVAALRPCDLRVSVEVGSGTEMSSESAGGCSDSFSEWDCEVQLAVRASESGRTALFYETKGFALIPDSIVRGRARSRSHVTPASHFAGEPGMEAELSHHLGYDRGEEPPSE